MYYYIFQKISKKTTIPIFPDRIKNGQEKMSKNESAGKDRKTEKTKNSEKLVLDHNALISIFNKNICDCKIFEIL